MIWRILNARFFSFCRHWHLKKGVGYRSEGALIRESITKSQSLAMTLMDHNVYSWQESSQLTLFCAMEHFFKTVRTAITKSQKN